MFKEMLRLFLSGVIAGFLSNFIFLLPLPALPYNLTQILAFGVLVVAVDFILKDILHI